MSVVISRAAVAPAHAAAPGWPGFVRAAMRRSTWASWAAAFAALLSLNLVREAGMYVGVTEPQFQPFHDFSGVACVMLLQWLCLVPAVLLADEAVAHGARRLRAYGSAVLLACAAAALAQYPIWWPPVQEFVPFSQQEIQVCRIDRALMMFAYQLMACSLAVFARVHLLAAREAQARRHAADIARLDAGRQALQSRLKAMQARVEPQFLFNTLAQVRQLHTLDAHAGDKMLDDLIAYLRAALPQLRESSSTLGRELELARAYLEIVRAGPGDRLAVDIRAPQALAPSRLPSMLLLPLLDHALAQGQAHEWREIRIETSAGDGRLLLAIADSACGFSPDAAEALQVLSERLRALYDDAAVLRLERLPGHGTRAILEIPHETPDRDPR